MSAPQIASKFKSNEKHRMERSEADEEHAESVGACLIFYSILFPVL
jgi:hypothetical protein